MARASTADLEQGRLTILRKRQEVLRSGTADAQERASQLWSAALTLEHAIMQKKGR